MDLTRADKRTERAQTRVYMAPLIDIVFLLLIFFMSAAIFYQLESEINISVPSTEEGERTPRAAGEVIVNVRQDGTVVVNQRQMGDDELRSMFARIAEVYRDQPVIIRADKKTFHEDVVRVLDMCAGAGIWNISFAVLKEEGGI